MKCWFKIPIYRDWPTEEFQMPSLGDTIRAVGEAVIAASADQVVAVLLSELQRLIPAPFRVESGIVVDSEGRRTEPLAA
jgi:hypothetical protein